MILGNDIGNNIGNDIGNDNDNDNKDKFLTVWGNDEDFRIYIPLIKGIYPYSEVLIADKMNGTPIPRDHGYPLRLIVPGGVATKQVKWLSHIEITDNPCDSSWQSGVAYKMLPTNITDFSEVTPELLNSIATADILPVQSLICDITTNILDENNLLLKGIALSGNGRNIIIVEVSIDNGKTWQESILKECDN